MRHPIALAIAITIGLLAAACGGPAPSAAPSGVGAGTGPVQAAKVEGPFRLTFDLPRDTWKTGDAIDGTAALSLDLGARSDLGGSGGGLIGFTFEEVGGDARAMGGLMTSDCRGYQLDAGRPMTSTIQKSAAYAADDPNADFYRAFIADPLVHLPAGDWKISAVASFVEGKGCSGASHTMLATILVHVLP